MKDDSSLRTGNAARGALEALALRCEREEPSSYLDLAILNALLGPVGDPWIWYDRQTETVTRQTYGPAAPGNPVCSLDEFTSSLDAAETLVAHGSEWSITNLYGVAHAEVGLNLSDSSGWQSGDHKGGHMALALCAASLRAIASAGKDASGEKAGLTQAAVIGSELSSPSIKECGPSGRADPGNGKID